MILKIITYAILALGTGFVLACLFGLVARFGGAAGERKDGDL